MKCLIKKAVDMNRVGGGVIVYVILVCILATGYSEGGRRRFNDNGDGWISAEVDEYTAEQIWKHCRQELMDMKETLTDYGLYDSEDSTGILLSSNLHEAINSLPLQLQHSLFTCLRNKIIPTNRNWISEYLELIISWPSTPRRYLVSDTHETVSTNHAPAPAPSNQAPSPALAFAPGPALDSPSYSPMIAPTPDPEPPSEAPDIISAPPPLKGTHYLPRLNVPSFRKDEEEKKRKLATIAASLLVIFLLLFASLLILCYVKRGRNKIDPQEGQKAVKPLLNLPLSDFSNGSSPDYIGNSGDKDFGVTTKLVAVSYTMAHAPSSEGLSKNVNAPIPLPPLMASPGKKAPSPTGPPPPPAPKSSTGPPPPPPKVARPPPAPPGNLKKIPPSPLGPGVIGDATKGDSDAPKTKLKPFFWDKVQANPDQSMVWHELSAGSFQFNEQMMESLFGYAPERNKINRKSDSSSSSVEGATQYIQIIDSRKAQNLSILLRALNVTSEEVCDALREGTELPIELVQTLLKMAPTNDEELKLRLFSGELSQLGPAERFLKVLVEIPFAFKRLESLLFMSSAQEEASNAKESFATFEVACNKLKNSRLFLKLLEAVLKTGNRMNDGTYRGGAQAFKLDTLLKLSDVKGTDGKTTLLHFVVQEIIRSEGVKVARANGDSTTDREEHYRNLGLEVVSSVSTELEDVKKAAVIDSDGLMSTVSKLGHTLMKNQNFLNFEMKNLEEESEFHSTVSSSVEKVGTDIKWLIEEEKRIMALVKSTAEYFYGQSGKDEGLRLFVIVRDFLVMLDKVCKEVKDTAAKKTKMVIKKEASASESSEARRPQLSDIHRRLFPAIIHRRMDSFGSEDDTESP